MKYDLNLQEFLDNASKVSDGIADTADSFHEALRNMNRERERQKRFEEEERQKEFERTQALLDKIGIPMVQ